MSIVTITAKKIYSMWHHKSLQYVAWQAKAYDNRRHSIRKQPMARSLVHKSLNLEASPDRALNTPTFWPRIKGKWFNCRTISLSLEARMTLIIFSSLYRSMKIRFTSHVEGKIFLREKLTSDSSTFEPNTFFSTPKKYVLSST
jgi:hypothetical protein